MIRLLTEIQAILIVNCFSEACGQKKTGPLIIEIIRVTATMINNMGSKRKKRERESNQNHKSATYLQVLIPLHYVRHTGKGEEIKG